MMLCLPASPAKGGKHRRRYSGGHRSHTSDAGSAARGGGRNSPSPQKDNGVADPPPLCGKALSFGPASCKRSCGFPSPPAVCKKNAVPFYGTAFSICHYLPGFDVARQIVQRVLVHDLAHTVDHGGGADLIMQMRAGGGAGVAGDADHGTLRDSLAL